jgi:hypothetical protein
MNPAVERYAAAVAAPCYRVETFPAFQRVTFVGMSTGRNTALDALSALAQLAEAAGFTADVYQDRRGAALDVSMREEPTTEQAEQAEQAGQSGECGEDEGVQGDEDVAGAIREVERAGMPW